jgi:hypothetical protein
MSTPLVNAYGVACKHYTLWLAAAMLLRFVGQRLPGLVELVLWAACAVCMVVGARFLAACMRAAMVVQRRLPKLNATLALDMFLVLFGYGLVVYDLFDGSVFGFVISTLISTSAMARMLEATEGVFLNSRR